MSAALGLYRCQRCDCRIWFAAGEWGCACWAVSAQALQQGGAALPPAWRPLAPVSPHGAGAGEEEG